jgi:hypothetical protein
MTVWSACDTAFVCGVGLNARTIVDELGRLGWPGAVAIVATSAEPLAFVERPVRRRGLRVHRYDGRDVDAVPTALAASLGGGASGIVFFTDERLLPSFARWATEHPAGPLVFHIGDPRRVDVILDRVAFYEVIAALDGVHVPLTLVGEADPFEVLGDTFMLRPRVSWQANGVRLSVRPIRGRAAFDAEIRRLQAMGLGRNVLCFQQMLSTRAEDNVSISGWYDQEPPAFMASRKVLQHPEEVGDGDLVEAIPMPLDLERQALAILAALEYRGPFELEFVRDPEAGTYRVIELNPRFWLQHGLLERRVPVGVIARYLGARSAETAEGRSVPHFWVNPGYALYRLGRADLRVLRALLTGRAWAPIGALEALATALSDRRWARLPTSNGRNPRG